MKPSTTSWLKRLIGFFVTFDRRIPADAGTHKTYLAIVAVMLIFPFFLSIPADKQECICCGGMCLPSTCLSQRLFNTQCPGCGLTHSFVSLTHGRLRESFRWNRMGIPLYLFFLFQAVFRIQILIRPAIVRAPLAIFLQHYVSWSVIVLLMVNWFSGIWLGSNGS